MIIERLLNSFEYLAAPLIGRRASSSVIKAKWTANLRSAAPGANPGELDTNFLRGGPIS